MIATLGRQAACGWCCRTNWPTSSDAISCGNSSLDWPSLATGSIRWFGLRCGACVRSGSCACDDQVLLTGVTSVDYAAGLVEVAAMLLGKKQSLAGGIGMIQRSQLEGRVRAILDTSSARNPIPLWARRAILLGTACVALTLGLLRPFSPIHSRAAENQPAKSTVVAEVQPMPDPAAATSPDADALSQCFADALSQQGISFLDDNKIAALRTDLHDYLQEKVKPSLNSERRDALRVGIQHFVETNFHDTDNVYLSFRDVLETLKWELWIAATRPELSDEQLARRDEQQKWMLDYINGLPEHDGFTRQDAIAKLQGAVTDPINPFFVEPLTEKEFTAFKKHITEMPTGNDVTFGDTNVYHTLIDAQMESLLKRWPVKQIGWSKYGMQWYLGVTPHKSGNSIPITDVNTHDRMIYVDVMRGNVLMQPAPQDPTVRSAWLESHNERGLQGDLSFDAQQDAFVAVRGAKLALLDAGSWADADRKKLVDLRKLIAEKGAASVPFSTEFTVPDPPFHIKQLKPNAPSIVVQTKEGGISVVRVTMLTGGPAPLPVAISAHPRPLAPNPPLNPGDASPTAVTPTGPAASITTHSDAAMSADAPTAAEKSAAEQSAGTSSTSGPTAHSLFDDEGNQPTKGDIKIRVVDAHGEPLSGVQIHVSVWTHEDNFKTNRDYTSDANGQVEAKLPGTLYILRLWATKHGYVSGFQDWENNPTNKRKPVPDEYTFHLQTGTVMGGIVVDEDGHRVSGATVQVTSNRGGSLAEGSDLRTDAEGRWKLENVPPGDDLEVRVIASHPDYISLRSHFDMGLEKPVPITELRAQTATIVLKRGVRVTGTITDSAGQPVVGALAIWGDQPYWEHRPQQEVRSDNQGVYQLPPLPPGPMRLTVVAQGWMPETRQIYIATELGPLDFKLKPGKTLRIRLVDIGGAPVGNALFQIESWRGAMSLYNNKHPNVIDSKIPRNSDKDGIYEWTWAPDDPVTFRISANDNSSTPKVDFTADDQEHVFTLLPLLRIAGKVSDATTSKPIDKFTIVIVEELAPGLAVTERHNALERSRGQYVTDKLDRIDVGYRVRIEANGYRSAISNVFHVGDHNPTADFLLESAPAASGRVIDSDGNPVKGAKVYLATKMQNLRDLQSDTEGAFGNDFRVETNQQGEFQFPAQFERYAVIAICDVGYAEVNLRPHQSPGEVKLKKWAQVGGRLLQAGIPVANARVYLTPIRPRFGDWPSIDDGLATESDQNGDFVFARVPPVKSFDSGRFITLGEISDHF